MKAIVYYKYGSPDVVRCEEIEKPTAGDDEVLVQVHAASVNPLDWHFMRAEPYIGRLVFGLRKPKFPRLGVDLAGRVEAVGRFVTRFQPGDEVFGTGRGAFAEYACAKPTKLVLKPANLTFEQAAAVPVAAITALQGLRDRGRVQPGQSVLINGAAGGVGTFAVQIAKAFGANVTAVCSTRNADLVRSIGADQVVDYTREDFASGGRRYDLLFDCMGNRSLSACRRIIGPRGSYVAIGGPAGRWIGPIASVLKMLLLAPLVSQNLAICMASVKQPDLLTLRELIEAGKVTPVLDRRYPLSEVPEALRYLEAGHARGKVAIAVAATPEAPPPPR